MPRHSASKDHALGLLRLLYKGVNSVGVPQESAEEHQALLLSDDEGMLTQEEEVEQRTAHVISSYVTIRADNISSTKDRCVGHCGIIQVLHPVSTAY